MAQPEYKPLRGLQLGGFVLLIIGVVVGVGFNEPAGTGVALVGIALLWGSRLVAWWRGRFK